MPRTLLLFLGLLAAGGCRLPPDREPLKPLPEEGPMFTYEQLLNRARVQAATALDAFYIDGWKDLEDAAHGLEQSARFMPRALEQPSLPKELIARNSDLLQKEAQVLLEAARKQQSDAANAALTRINQLIRALRPMDEGKGKVELPKKSGT